MLDVESAADSERGPLVETGIVNPAAHRRLNPPHQLLDVARRAFDIHLNAAVGFIADKPVYVESTCLCHGGHAEADALDVPGVTNDVANMVIIHGQYSSLCGTITIAIESTVVIPDEMRLHGRC